jgi:exopolysaccharide biosynthesis polyprenyl glycosylphosphotransferase
VSTTTFHPAGGWGARRALLTSEFLSLLISFYLSYRLLPLYRPYLRAESFSVGSFTAHAWLLLLIFPLWYLLLEKSGLNVATRMSWKVVVERTVRVQTLGLAALSVLIFTFKLQAVSRLLIFGFCLLAVPISMATRWLLLSALEAHRSHIYNIARILVIGTRQRAREFIRQTRTAEEGSYLVVGCLDPEPDQAPQEVEGVPLLGSTDIFQSYLFEHPVDVVVFAMPLERVPQAKSLLDAALELGLRVAVLPDFYIQRLGYALDRQLAAIDFFLGRPVAALSSVPLRTTYRAAKRAMDVVISATLLLLLAPVFALLAVLIKLISPDGPVFYRWKVLGVNKKPFVSYKFRTMVPQAEQLKPRILQQNEMVGPVFKMRNDPRIIPLGHFLRKYSLDELPQLYSVLKGDMSLVGPRPPFQEEADRYEFWQRRKLSIKPGITCLWQVNGRNEIHSFDAWARLDLEYVQSASLWLDCKILLKTIPAVLRGRGAY